MSEFGAGSVLRTSDGELIAAGVRVRVFNMHLISGGTASVIALINGGSSGTTYIKETGTANTGKTFDYGTEGHLFPNGCYADVDANIVSVLVSCRKEI